MSKRNAKDREISFKVEEEVWNKLKEIAEESHQSVSELLTEAIEDYVKGHRARANILMHLEDSMGENKELGRLLAD